LMALPLRADFSVTVLVGGSNPHLTSVREVIERVGLNVNVVIDCPHVAELMSTVHIAVAAAGSTAWELAFFGIPSLLIVVADNQQRVADACVAAKIARVTTVETLRGDLTDMISDLKFRTEAAESGVTFVDGHGSMRVAAKLLGKTLSFRLAERRDCEMIWHWANDPDTRKESFSSAPIPYEQHVKWFENRLSDPYTLFLVVMDFKGTPIGQVRFQVDGARAVISVSIDREHRGQGYGAEVIAQGTKYALERWGVDVIDAYIKMGNTSSQNAFARAGYHESRRAEVAAVPAIVMSKATV
jgi:UDP-2,4-diacetamido-2,4,6-trideoxy-beta-L-altropyranose hydrolase